MDFTLASLLHTLYLLQGEEAIDGGVEVTVGRRRAAHRAASGRKRWC